MAVAAKTEEGVNALSVGEGVSSRHHLACMRHDAAAVHNNDSISIFNEWEVPAGVATFLGIGGIGQGAFSSILTY